ncbi:pilus assembly protein CpaF, partial [Propionibacterium freudenreichii]|nr:pilus assembly protein CpaF [Propionibacterium freudenreichii]
TRLHTVLACLAEPGTCISLRVPARRRMTLDQLTTDGSIDARIADVLQGLVANRAAYLVTGGTGTGKTTILGMLLGLVPDSERIVIVEDSRELNPTHDHVVRMECRPANAEGVGSVAMTDLVKQALRMRPDRLVVGEVRGPELCDLLTAMNTGHEGGCGTVHANSVTDVPARLEALAALGGMGREACHAQMASA